MTTERLVYDTQEEHAAPKGGCESEGGPRKYKTLKFVRVVQAGFRYSDRWQ
jgi:hypothetical protein